MVNGGEVGGGPTARRASGRQQVVGMVAADEASLKAGRSLVCTCYWMGRQGSRQQAAGSRQQAGKCASMQASQQLHSVIGSSSFCSSAVPATAAPRLLGHDVAVFAAALLQQLREVYCCSVITSSSAKQRSNSIEVAGGVEDVCSVRHCSSSSGSKMTLRTASGRRAGAAGAARWRRRSRSSRSRRRKQARLRHGGCTSRKPLL